MNIILGLVLVIALICPPMGAAESVLQREPAHDEVGIYFSGVQVPLNTILLIRINNDYCALKFLRTWDEVDDKTLAEFANGIRDGGISAETAREASLKKYATYESYYPMAGASAFTKNDLRKEKRTASLLPLRGPFRPFIYQPGNGCVECGPNKLLWEYKTFVSFVPLGKGSKSRQDYGYEFAPTQWSNISQVNVLDPRITWYRYDEKRERLFISIDSLWGAGK